MVYPYVSAAELQKNAKQTTASYNSILSSKKAKKQHDHTAMLKCFLKIHTIILSNCKAETSTVSAVNKQADSKLDT